MGCCVVSEKLHFSTAHCTCVSVHPSAVFNFDCICFLYVTQTHICYNICIDDDDYLVSQKESLGICGVDSLGWM